MQAPKVDLDVRTAYFCWNEGLTHFSVANVSSGINQATRLAISGSPSMRWRRVNMMLVADEGVAFYWAGGL